MSSMVLIDSSVWVEVSRRGGDAVLAEEVAKLMDARRAAMTWPVWMELYQGARGRREEEVLKGWREVSIWLDFDETCWNRAAVTAQACLRSGVNVPFGDVLVHACAKRHNVYLLERDRHFAMIEKAFEK